MSLMSSISAPAILESLNFHQKLSSFFNSSLETHLEEEGFLEHIVKNKNSLLLSTYHVLETPRMYSHLTPKQRNVKSSYYTDKESKAQGD